MARRSIGVTNAGFLMISYLGTNLTEIRLYYKDFDIRNLIWNSRLKMAVNFYGP